MKITNPLYGFFFSLCLGLAAQEPELVRRWKELRDASTHALADGRYSQALALADQALLVYPRDCNLYFNRGAAFNRLGRHAEAVKALTIAFNLQGAVETGLIQIPSSEPEFLPVIPVLSETDLAFELGWAYLGSGDAKRAAFIFTQLSLAKPNDPLVQEFLGRALYLQGDYQAASSILQKATHSQPTLTGAYYAGLAIAQVQGEEQAREYFQQLRQRNPDLPAWEALASTHRL